MLNNPEFFLSSRTKSLFVMNRLRSINTESVSMAVDELLHRFNAISDDYADFIKLKPNKESYLAFVAGSFVLNFQNKYRFRCRLDKFAYDGSILFTVLPIMNGQTKLGSHIPILFNSVEYSEIARRIYIIKETGVSELLPSFASESKMAVIGIMTVQQKNLPHIFVDTIEINRSFVYKFLETYERIIKLDMGINCSQFLSIELQTIFDFVGSKKSSMISSFLLGQILSLKASPSDSSGENVDQRLNKFEYEYEDLTLAKEVTNYSIFYRQAVISFNIVEDFEQKEELRFFFQKNMHHQYNYLDDFIYEHKIQVDFSLSVKNESKLAVKHIKIQDLKSSTQVYHQGRSKLIFTVDINKLVINFENKDISGVRDELQSKLSNHMTLVNDNQLFYTLLK